MKKIYSLFVIALVSQTSFSAELFVRMLRPGSYVATAYNQTQFNPTNTYRFFELPGGNVSLQINDQQNGFSVYNGSLNLAANQRVVAEIDTYGNFKIIQNTYIASTNWYTTNPGEVCTHPGTIPGNGYPGGGYYPPNPANDPAFQQFLGMLDQESFDSNKLTAAKSYASKTNLSAQQIAEINKKYTFDSNRLEWAKYAYSKCYDKANYFLLKSTFAYSSNYSALEDYIEGL